MYTEIKRKLTNGDLSSKEKAIYEYALKFVAGNYLNIKDCCLYYSKFGIIIKPNIYKEKKHSNLILRRFVNGELHSTSKFLSHQIYLHDLVKFKWKQEELNIENKVRFEIECVRKTPEIVMIY